MNRKEIHYIFYVFSLLFLASSIPVSNFGMSLGGIMLFTNWIIEGDWRRKWEQLKNNKLALILASFFFVYIIGFIHTNDWHEGLNNMLSKLPLLYAPVIMASSTKLDGKSLRLIITGFVISTWVGTLISVSLFFTKPINDLREISIFISHIRFSLCIVLAIIFAIWFAFRCTLYRTAFRVFYFLLAVWFTSYLFISQTLTGIFILLLVAISFMIYLFYHYQKGMIRNLFIFSVIAIILGITSYIGVLTYQYFHVSQSAAAPLEKYTKSGNLYTHNTASLVESGYYIDYYVCEPELRETWGKRSPVPYDTVSPSLIRYLNSKGLRKDKEGVENLSSEDIHNIEKGMANYHYAEHFGLKRALYSTFFSLSIYYDSGKIDGSSFMQRIELWKASLNIIGEHPLLGIGIGDHRGELDRKLAQKESPLSYRGMGCHNQFLSFGVMGGIFVMLYFVFILFLPFFVKKKDISIFYILFFLIIFLSLFMEDTLETQAGMTLYTFFNAFLLFCFDTKKMNNPATKLFPTNNKRIKNNKILRFLQTFYITKDEDQKFHH